MRGAVLSIVLCAAAGCSEPGPPTPANAPPAAAEPPEGLPKSSTPAAGGAAKPPTVSRSASTASVAELHKIADDPRASRDARGAAVYALFANHLRPPCNPAAVGKVLGEANWLKDSGLYYLHGLGGWIPIEFGGDASVYHLALFPDEDGQSDWGMYLRLSGNWSVEEARAFLRGEKGLKGAPELVEFALCYPPEPGELGTGRCENFGAKGMAVLQGGVVVPKD